MNQNIRPRRNHGRPKQSCLGASKSRPPPIMIFDHQDRSCACPYRTREAVKVHYRPREMARFICSSTSVGEEDARRVRRGAEIWPCPAHVHVEKHKSVEILCLSIPFHCKRSQRKMTVPQDMYKRRLLDIEYLDLDYKQDLAFCQLKKRFRCMWQMPYQVSRFGPPT